MQFLFRLCHLTSWKVFVVLCLFINVLFMAVCVTGRALMGTELSAAGAVPIKTCSKTQSQAQPVQNSPDTALGLWGLGLTPQSTQSSQKYQLFSPEPNHNPSSRAAKGGTAEDAAASLSPQLLQTASSSHRNDRRNTFNKTFQELVSARIGNRRWRII